MLGDAAFLVLGAAIVFYLALWRLSRRGPRPRRVRRRPPRPDPRYGQLADAIEAELRASGAWNPSPAPFERIVSGGAFGAGAVPFEEWVQVVLLARLRAVAAGELGAPRRSEVGVYAHRALDGVPGRERLLDLMRAVDDLAAEGRWSGV